MSVRKTLAGIAGYALVGAIALGIGGTLAHNEYETPTDGNTYTVGNVKIKQLEKERIVQNNDNTSPENLQDYENNKPLYPACGDIAWVQDENGNNVYQQWPTGGGSALFDAEKLGNVQDKIVFVENTGSNDAFVRTVFAFEAGNMTAEQMNNDLIHWNRNTDHWSWTDFSEGMTATIKGEKYYLRVATYKGSDTVHSGGILPAGETTRPSLLQFFLDEEADNELCASFNDTYDILVVSQAVQTEMKGMTAADALDEAFGEITAETHPWTETTFVESAEDLAAAIAAGGEVVLTADVDLTDTPITILADSEVTLNLNGFDITPPDANAETGRSIYAIDNCGELTLTGKGTIEARGIQNFGKMTIDGDDITIIARDTNGGAAIWNEGTLTINNGTFTTVTTNDGVSPDPTPLINDGGNVTINGGTFISNTYWTYAICNQNDGTMEINSVDAKGVHGALANLSGEIVVNGGAFECTGKDNKVSDHCVYAPEGTVTINGGEFTGSGETGTGDSVFYADDGHIVDNRTTAE